MRRTRPKSESNLKQRAKRQTLQGDAESQAREARDTTNDPDQQPPNNLIFKMRRPASRTEYPDSSSRPSPLEYQRRYPRRNHRHGRGRQHNTPAVAGSPAEGDSTSVVAVAGIRPVEGIRIPVAEEIHSLAGEESQRSSHAKRRAEEWAGRRGRGPGQGRKEADRPGWMLA